MRLQERPVDCEVVNVADVIGSHFCVTAEDGQKLFEVLAERFHANTCVALDFAHVKVCSSPFLNVAVGSHLEHMKPEQLSAVLKWQNISPATEQLLIDVIENAERYYSDPSIRKLWD